MFRREKRYPTPQLKTNPKRKPPLFPMIKISFLINLPKIAVNVLITPFLLNPSLKTVRRRLILS
jgi:hypothetical protein